MAVVLLCKTVSNPIFAENAFLESYFRKKTLKGDYSISEQASLKINRPRRHRCHGRIKQYTLRCDLTFASENNPEQ